MKNKTIASLYSPLISAINSSDTTPLTIAEYVGSFGNESIRSEVVKLIRGILDKSLYDKDIVDIFCKIVSDLPVDDNRIVFHKPNGGYRFNIGMIKTKVLFKGKEYFDNLKREQTAQLPGSSGFGLTLIFGTPFQYTFADISEKEFGNHTIGVSSGILYLQDSGNDIINNTIRDLIIDLFTITNHDVFHTIERLIWQYDSSFLQLAKDRLNGKVDPNLLFHVELNNQYHLLNLLILLYGKDKLLNMMANKLHNFCDVISGYEEKQQDYYLGIFLFFFRRIFPISQFKESHSELYEKYKRIRHYKTPSWYGGMPYWQAIESYVKAL